MEKLLPSDGRTKLGRLLQKLECAERASGEMRRSKICLDDLERFRPDTLAQSQAPGLYATALLPIIDHTLTVYCSAFNSNDRIAGGIGRFDARDVFGENEGRQNWHRFLKEYRDKNVAHLTNHHRKTWYLTSKDDRRIGSAGIGGLLPNFLQPGADAWLPFRDHLRFTQSWFEKKAIEIRRKSEKILSSMPECWFDGLTIPEEEPLIAKSWAVHAEIMASIALSNVSQNASDDDILD